MWKASSFNATLGSQVAKISCLFRVSFRIVAMMSSAKFVDIQWLASVAEMGEMCRACGWWQRCGRVDRCVEGGGDVGELTGLWRVAEMWES